MRWVGFRPVEVLGLGLHGPANDAIVNRDANERSEKLREEHGSLGDVHVVADFLILEHELGPVPCISCYGAVHSCPAWIVVSIYSVDHQAVQEFIHGPDRL